MGHLHSGLHRNSTGVLTLADGLGTTSERIGPVAGNQFPPRFWSCDDFGQGRAAWNVSQLETCPDLSPVMNQRVRCSDEPWVKASGTT